MLGDGDYEVNAGSLERLVNEGMSALETACTQTSFPREDWPGAFASAASSPASSSPLGRWRDTADDGCGGTTRPCASIAKT